MMMALDNRSVDKSSNNSSSGDHEYSSKLHANPPNKNYTLNLVEALEGESEDHQSQ